MVSILIGKPSRYRLKHIVYGHLYLVPALFLILAAALGFCLIPRDTFIESYIPVFILLGILMLYIFPLWNGNPYIRHVTNGIARPPCGEEAVIVQISLCPRMRKGVERILEEADDIGIMTLSPDALLFYGDAIRLSIPYGRISSIIIKNAGIHGFWYFCGKRIFLYSDDFGEIRHLEIRERQSRTVADSYRTSNNLIRDLRIRWDQARAPTTSGGSA